MLFLGCVLMVGCCMQGWLPGKGYGFFRRFIIIFIILAICLAVSLGAPFDSAQVSALRGGLSAFALSSHSDYSLHLIRQICMGQIAAS